MPVLAGLTRVPVHGRSLPGNLELGRKMSPRGPNTDIESRPHA
jgi:hypothetical protein